MSEQGTAFGSYVLLKRLARGGMAEVFLARQHGPEGFDRQVAVKRILPHLADSEDFVRQFHDEARLAARLSHPNVVHIYEFGKVGDHYFIAMEYVDGVHAGALIEHGAMERMPPALVARIGADACAGLNYAHRLKDEGGRPLHLVHRDISPPNLMISSDGVVKLVDFGIAKAVNMMNKTRPGIVKGKFAYMSPEQTMGKKLDGRSDVFSLALVCWELLAGRVALDRTDPVEAMKCIRDGKLPSIFDARPDTPPPLARILDQALAVRPEERLSALELGNALEGFIKSSPELGTSMQLAEWVSTRFSGGPPGSIDAPMPPGNMAPGGPGSMAPAGPVEPRSKDYGNPAAAAEVSAPRPRSRTVPPSFDPKVSFLQDVDDDDAPTQITSQPMHPVDVNRLPRPNPAPRPPSTVPPVGQQPAPMPMAAPAGNPWSRLTGSMFLQNRRRRIVIVAIFATILLVVIALAVSSNNSETKAEPKSDNVVNAGLDAGADAAMDEPPASADAGSVEAGAIKPERAWLEVITVPKGALVSLDDRDPLESPAVFEDLEPGEHTILIENEGYEDIEQSVILAPGVKTLEFELKKESKEASRPRSRKGSLSVVTKPSSQVYIGKRKLDSTPFANKRLKAGTYTLTFKKRGYKSVKKRVTIRPGQTTKLNFSLPRR